MEPHEWLCMQAPSRTPHAMATPAVALGSPAAPEGGGGGRLTTPPQETLQLAPLGQDSSPTESLERTASLSSLPSLGSLPPLGSPLVPAAIPAAAVPVHQAHFVFLAASQPPQSQHPQQPQQRQQASPQWSRVDGMPPLQLPGDLLVADGACGQLPTYNLVREGAWEPAYSEIGPCACTASAFASHQLTAAGPAQAANGTCGDAHTVDCPPHACRRTWTLGWMHCKWLG